MDLHKKGTLITLILFGLILGFSQNFLEDVFRSNNANFSSWSSTVRSRSLVLKIEDKTEASIIDFPTKTVLSINPCDFITTWETTTPNKQINLPLNEVVNSVDWGDGTVDTNLSHTYVSPGTYTVTVDADLTQLSATFATANTQNLLSVEQWGCSQWTSFDLANCFNLEVNATDTPDLTNTTSLSGAFLGCTSLGVGMGLANWNWNVSSIQDMSSMFRDAENFDQDISSWDTSNVSNMQQMFENAASFNQPIGSWNTQSLINTADMFRSANAFNQILNGWDVSNVTSMSGMFSAAENFNQDLNSWNTSNVVDMSRLFSKATDFNGNISNWNTSSVTDMSLMFNQTPVFNNNIGNWNTGNVQSMFLMFFEAIVFNRDIGNWNTAKVTNMSGMFREALAFNQDIGAWNTGNVTTMQLMFSEAGSFNQDIGNWNTSSLLNTANMFEDAASFDQNLGNWNVSALTNATDMFANIALSTPNYDALLIGWDTQGLNNNVTFGGGLSQYCLGKSARSNIISSDSWTINDGGPEGPEVDILANQTATDSFTFPAITGVNLSGNEAYYTGPNGTGTQYFPGDTVNFADLPSYPFTIYIFDTDITGCDSEEEFQLTISSTNNPFITTWKTDNPGISNNNQITIPTNGGGYNYTIHWGDGNSDTNVAGDITHTYATAGTYTVSISGDFPALFFNDLGDKQKILTIEQWGDIEWASMRAAFMGCINLQGAYTDRPNLSNVLDMSLMFAACTSFNHPVGDWDVSNVEIMVSTFEQAISFNQDISGWGVSNVNSMQDMFRQATSFNQDLNTWDTSSVETMSGMFWDATTFNGEISNWDTKNVTTMELMFSGANSFNKNIGSWDTGSVINMFFTFGSAPSFNQDISSWDVSNVETMRGMFAGAVSFNQDIGGWDIGNVVSFIQTFDNAISFNQDIGNWDTSSVTTMRWMFRDAINFDQDLGNWDVTSLTDAFNMFFGVQLSVANYDSLLIGWNSQALKPNVPFDGGNSQYCSGESSRVNMIASDGWTIIDAGFVGSTVDDLADQIVSGSFTFPAITGTNLSGNEAYFTGPNGTGTQYNPGDVVNFADFPSYPVVIYIYDETSPGCTSQEDFLLTITPILDCTNLSSPLNGDVDVVVDTDINWSASSGATGYLLTVGTAPGGNNILNSLDVGNVLSYDFPTDLPDDTTIYVLIVPYDSNGPASGCTEESFTTVDILFPPTCTSLVSPLNGDVNVLVGTDLIWNAVADATGYVLTVGTTPGGAEILDAVDVGNTTTYDFTSNLPDDTTIYVLVVPYNTGGDATGCAEESFTTEDLQVLSCTNLTSPVPGSVGVPVDSDFIWNVATDAIGYRVFIGTSPGNYDILNGLDVGNVLTFDLTNDLPDDTTIYVLIVPYSIDGDAIGCVEESFTTIDLLFPPGCTTLTSPIAGSVDVPIEADISWNGVSDADGYLISVGTTPGGSEVVNALDVGNVLTYNFPVDLPENVTIYVLITPYNDDGDAVGCTEESFTTINLLFPPDCTSLSSPLSGERDVRVDTDIIWSPSFGALGYFLSVGTTSNGTDIIDRLDVGNVLFFDFANDLPEETIIYVTIVPYNIDGEAIGCLSESFETESLFPDPPKFFTPNGDGNNDTWIIEDRLNLIDNVKIFDRYGKLLVIINPSFFSWDGIYNGNMLPSSDYWYVVELKDGRSLTGHFSLAR